MDKPRFQGVVDLGLRDVGVRTDRRRLAAHFGKASLAAVAMAVVSVLALCVLVTQTSAGGPWVAAVFVAVTMAGALLLALRMVRRSPPVVVKVNAEGKNQAAGLLIGSFLLLAAHAAVFRDPVLIPVAALSLIMALVLWRARGRLPEILRQLRGLLAANESVLGDGVGVMPGAHGFRGRQAAWRLVVATDRRLLMTRSTRPSQPFVVVDAPYRDISRFGIEWTRRGYVGVLSLTAPAADGTSPETHVIGNMTPANLLSIARALQAHGVPPDDPAALEEAEHGWEEARRAWAEGRRPGEQQQRPGLIDRSAMSTRQFDRGLWLLLGASAVILYTSVIGDGFAALAVIGALCGLCGYLSGTRSSLAYVVPLNLLLIPNFFFTGPSDVIVLMVLVSVVALACLWAGSALRRGASAGERAAPAAGGLRYAISGVGLIRISGVLLVAMLALVVVTSAAGFELTSLRLAVDEATAKQVPVDGRSNLTGNAASLTYTRGPGLHEFITDEDWGAGPNDGARWELRSSFTKNENVVSLSHYIFEPRLDNPAAVAKFVADKDDEHSRMARHRVGHTKRVVDGRTGYVWTHGNRFGYWHYAVWFPHPVHTIRVECIAKQEAERFKRLCEEALGSLEFH
jgi:hypothetical protein